MTTPQEVSICAKHVRGLAIHGGSWAVLDRAADMLEELARLKEVRDEDVYRATEAFCVAMLHPEKMDAQEATRAAIVAYLGGE